MAGKRKSHNTTIWIVLLMAYFFIVAPYISRSINPPPPEEENAPQQESEKKSSKKNKSAPKTIEAEKDVAKPVDAKATTPAETATADAPKIAAANTKISDKQPKEIESYSLESEDLHIEFTNVGGAIKSVLLPNYFAAPKPWEKPSEKLKILEPLTQAYLPLILTGVPDDEGSGILSGADADLANRRFFAVVDKAERKIVFTTTIDNKIIVEKTYIIPEKGYRIEFQLKLQNIGNDEQKLRYRLFCGSGLKKEESGRQYLRTGVVGYRVPGDQVKTADGSDLDFSESEESKIAWAAVRDKYFAAILMPKTNGKKSDSIGHVASFVFDTEDEDFGEDLAVAMDSNRVKIQSGESFEQGFTYYVGPIDKSMLKEDFGAILSFGSYLGWISEIMLFVLNGIYVALPNYGICILLLTIIMQVLTHPLTKKQQISMFKMQKLGPHLKQLREKYKSDKNKLNTETWALYKKAGVNPFAGCWPMLIQIPIFIALYTALNQAIELRQAGFMWWIDDLSQPDAVMPLNISFLFISIKSLNILPLMMTASMLIQQWLMPKTQDAQAQQQQKMMMFMPVIFLFILYDLPSGLCLYWTFRNILSIVEQKIIKKHLAAEDEQVDIRKEKKSNNL